MYSNLISLNASTALPFLLDRLADAPQVDTRGGRTKELTHVGITIQKPWQRELLVPERKPNIAAQIFETMWVLSGRDDMESLLRYLPRAADFSDDGQKWRAGYGARLRGWAGEVDQLAYVVDTLRRDPLSRQAVMSIWDPEIDTEPGKDIPCNNWLSFSLRNGVLDLHVAIRSNDVIWGWSGINQFEWSALQEIVAGLLGVQTGSLHFSVTSFHLYERHWEKATRIVTQDARKDQPTVADSPRFFAGGHDQIAQFDYLCKKWFEVEQQIREGHGVRVSIDTFPEPMLRSWLRVIEWWWSGDEHALEPLVGTRLMEATRYSVQPNHSAKVVPVVQDAVHPKPSAFAAEVVRLHDEKHAAYGDSWKRRGEMLGIMANIARKIDRLGGGETADETSSDTAMDLLVYLAKYRSWLADQRVDSDSSDDTAYANSLIFELDLFHATDWDTADELTVRGGIESRLRNAFDGLEYTVQNDPEKRVHVVEGMLRRAYRLARMLWEKAELPQPLEAAPTAEGAGHAERNARRSRSPEQPEERDPMHTCVHPNTGSHTCACRKSYDHEINGSPVPVQRDVVQS